jgi:hypothetical protein
LRRGLAAVQVQLHELIDYELNTVSLIWGLFIFFFVDANFSGSGRAQPPRRLLQESAGELVIELFPIFSLLA